MSTSLGSVPRPSSPPIPTETPSGSEPRSIRRVIRSSFPSSQNLSSSFNHRAPARSFVQHASPFSQGTDSARISPGQVHEQTAQLASRALSPTFPRRHSAHHDTSASISDSSLHILDGSGYSPDANSPRSQAINEEPPDSSKTPSSESKPHASKSSSMQPLHKRRGDSPVDSEDASPGRADMSDKIGKRISHGNADENTPLLDYGSHVSQASRYGRSKGGRDVEGEAPREKKPNTFQRMTRDCKQHALKAGYTVFNPKRWNARVAWERGVKLPMSLMPCVFLGVLLNVLDALSYGMILFPLGEPIFSTTGADGISMFYVSCIVSQIVYSGGGSIFKGGVGSEMIEVVPFFHKMAYSITTLAGRDRPQVVLATTITAFAASSILTGFVFFGLGTFRLGSLVNFFPRHILIGCIGGVGYFLFITGIEVSARVKGSLTYDLDTAEQLFGKDTVLLWAIPLLLSIALLTVKHFIRSPYVVPTFFVAIAGVFYVTVATVPSYNIPQLRVQGWIFPAVEAGVPWYNFYSHYNFKAVDWKAFVSTLPAMFALTFFGILHVPINVPALAIAAEEDDLNLNRELVAHGISNAVSGFAGSIQNYLVYVNSDLFISNGGNHRLAGLMLAAATFGVLLAGPDMIGFVPVMVVGALIFYLGIELLLEALYETWGKMNKLEYLTVVAIVLTMGIYDFVVGILVGIVLACLSYVVDTSAKSAIRATYSGATIESTVRRHAIQRHFLHRAGRQIHVTKLAGTLFFGSIVKVEKQSRALIEEEAFQEQPIRFLVFDLAHVNGLDYSAAEAFTRMQRVLGRRDVQMIMSGVSVESEVGKSLQNVGLLQDSSGVKFFENLNLALESCENQLLAEFYRQSNKLAEATSAGAQEYGSLGPPHMSPYKTIPSQQAQDSLDAPSQPAVGSEPQSSQLGASAASPRTHYLEEMASKTLDDQYDALPQKKWSNFKQPLPLLLHCMQGLSEKNEDFWFRAVQYFERQELQPGEALFHDHDKADAFYLLENGLLKATYELPMGGYHESIVAGTTCGELPFFSNTRRTATVVAETRRDSNNEVEDGPVVVWKLTADAWKCLQSAWPEGSQELLIVALRLTKERVDSVTGYVLTTAG